MKKITVLTIVKNNEATIEKLLNSVNYEDYEILIGDLGCTDKTIDICKKYATKIVKLSLNHDYSAAKNTLISHVTTDWFLSMEAWESLKHPVNTDNLAGNYRLYVFQEDIITKEVRLVNRQSNLLFQNPVFPSLSDSQANLLEIPIISENITNQTHQLELIEMWKKDNPFTHEPYYFQANILLSQNKTDEFLRIAEYYLFYEKQDIFTTTLLRYYMAIVYLKIKKDVQEASKNILSCLSINPTMAEFWCLLGDVYCILKKYNKAKEFYENAILLGSQRVKTDAWPIQLSKYKEYPEKMIKNCNEIIAAMKAANLLSY